MYQKINELGLGGYYLYDEDYEDNMKRGFPVIRRNIKINSYKKLLLKLKILSFIRRVKHAWIMFTIRLNWIKFNLKRRKV